MISHKSRVSSTHPLSTLAGRWDWRESPLISLQRHDETAPREAVASAMAEEERLRRLAAAKRQHLVASQRLAKRRVREYDKLRRAVGEKETEEAVSARSVSERGCESDRRLDEFDAEHVTCAVNAAFVETRDATLSGSRLAAQSKMARCRRVVAGQEDEEELTEVTEMGGETARSLEEVEEEEEVPPLLLTPGRSSAPTSDRTPEPPSSHRQQEAVRRARALDLYFYPRLASRETPAEDEELRRSRPLSCRRHFAEVERESARRTRQRLSADVKARKLKAAAEARRRREEAAHTVTAAPRGVDSKPQPQAKSEVEVEKREKTAVVRDASPQRYTTALRQRIRERCESASVEVPALCPCSANAWEIDPEQCAVNCVFYRNPRGLLRTLMSFVPDSDDK